MNKKEFLNYFKELDEFELSKLYEKFVLAQNKGIEVFTNEFYTPDIWSKLEKIISKNTTIDSYGIFYESDRRVIAFNKRLSEYPIKLLKIQCNTKFINLSHKDYLGSIMALGIKRSKFGELIVDDKYAYIAVHEDIIDFIMNNLTKIKNLTCKCTISDINENLPEVKYEVKNINTSSIRLDCIISSIINVSRNKSVELISQGKVLINYIEINDKSYDVQENSKITIRGFGKFKISEILGTTKSGRLKLTVFKYT